MKKKKNTSFLKKRIKIDTEGVHKEKHERDRAIYGVSTWDTYTMSDTLLIVLSNYLYQYIHDASKAIQQPDSYWKTMEKHAEAIRHFRNVENEATRVSEEEYNEARKGLKKALVWISNNIETLWW